MTKNTRGILLAISGASLWGTSGAAVQYLFTHAQVNAGWLVGLRLLSAGFLLVGYSWFTDRRASFRVFHSRKALRLLVLFSFLGMGSSQLTYFMAVKYSNAPTATVIQYLAPVIIVVYVAIHHRTLPRRIDVLSIGVALIGTFLLVTHGHLTQLALSPLACFWGLLAAVAEALNALMPGNLFKHFGTITIIGWSMVICGVAFIPLYFWVAPPVLTGLDIAVIVYIILGGTLLAYTLYLASLTAIDPSTTGMLGAFEPLVATILAVALLHTPVGLSDLSGGSLIILATFLQMWPHQRAQRH